MDKSNKKSRVQENKIEYFLNKSYGTQQKDGNYIIQKNPYPNLLLFILDFIVLKLFQPCKLILDIFLSGFFPTTKELKKPWVLLPVYLFIMPVTFIGFWITLPLSGIAFIFWYIINKFRILPYRLSYVVSAVNEKVHLKDTYCIGTSNLCFLPEFISRINNLDNLYQRTKKIGESIANSQLKWKKSNKNTNNNKNLKANNKKAWHTDHAKAKHDLKHETVSNFPETDVLLLQEIFDKEAAISIVRKLHQAYPYIIYDVGIDSWDTNYFLSNSGLCIASKYPIEEVFFRPYSAKMTQCALASKGLLGLKLYLGHTSGGHKVVGYVAATHMQAFHGTTQVHYIQLNECNQWLDEFRSQTLKPGEILAFDVFGGDLNVDNLSPVDQKEHNHALFDKYEDVCRIKAGSDHHWTVGTEMRHTPLHDKQVSTPEGLKQALDDPLLLQHYVLDGDISENVMEMCSFMPRRDQQGNEILSPVGGKRRIDYVIFRKGDGVVPLEYHAVTQLAGLTDHIPVTLTIQSPQVFKKED